MAERVRWFSAFCFLFNHHYPYSYLSSRHPTNDTSYPFSPHHTSPLCLLYLNPRSPSVRTSALMLSFITHLVWSYNREAQFVLDAISIQTWGNNARGKYYVTSEMVLVVTPMLNAHFVTKRHSMHAVMNVTSMISPKPHFMVNLYMCHMAHNRWFIAYDTQLYESYLAKDWLNVVARSVKQL